MIVALGDSFTLGWGATEGFTYADILERRINDGMTVALLIAGYEQSFVERALEGSTWAGYFAAQRAPWFLQGMLWREVWGTVMFVGVILLVWDFLAIGRHETRRAAEPGMEPVPA